MASTTLIRNHTAWRDASGAPIDCHEGQILRAGDVFYWYGRRYHGNLDGKFGSERAGLRLGIAVYSSRDLVNWTHHGECLSYPAPGATPGWMTAGTWHRPRIARHASGTFVLWIFCLGCTDGTWWARDIVATAPEPTGPFTIAGAPTISGVAGASGDHALFVDRDGRGYLGKGDWTRNNWIVPLTEDFTSTTGTPVLVQPADRAAQRAYEGVCVAAYRGKYLVAGSGVVGLAASETSYAVADDVLGPYRPKGFLSEEKTWSSQISSLFYLAETDRLIALCDQWLVGPDGRPCTGEESCQLWLPVTFDAAAERAEMQYAAAWDPWRKP